MRPRKPLATALICLALLTTLQARAQSPEQRGLAIVQEADRRDLGWGDISSKLRMVLRNRHGETSTRELRTQFLEMPGGRVDGDKALIVFSSPRDIEGMALLSHTKITEQDDQWLYLPALKRVKRVSSDNKSGPFVGSEFAYEDFLSQEVAKYTYRFLRNEPCGALACFVVERYPVYVNSGYTRQIVWIDEAAYRTQKVEYYDRKNDLLKTLIFKDYRQYLDHYWRADERVMENHQTGKSTTLLFTDYVFRSGLTEQDFIPARLQSLR